MPVRLLKRLKFIAVVEGIDQYRSRTKHWTRYIGFRAAVKRIPYRSRSTVNFSRVTSWRLPLSG